MAALAGWHPGERSIQTKLGVHDAVAHYHAFISGELPDEHRVFHTTRLPFLPITTLDAHGRPWTSIAAGPSGELGFATSPNYTDLRVHTRVVPGDPLADNVKLFGKGKMLIAGIGIEFSTRRRNKLAGYVTAVSQDGDTLDIDLEVNEAIGNCPKYINFRQLIPHPNIHPKVQFQILQMTDTARLPDELTDFIHASDTVFLGTSYVAKKEDERRFPSHLGQNQRGGRRGFVRASRSDGRTVVLPDYSGNRLLTSLGNIESTPLASLTFVSFTEGHILYLTGNARTLVGEQAQAIMPRQNVVTTVYVTGFVFVRDASTVRQRPGTDVGRSPYSPPVKLLAEELHGSAAALFDTGVTVTLTGVEMHTSELATFTWLASEPLLIQPGQTAVLDFKDLLGSAQYSHMAPWNPSSVNDDRVRTWTVSRAQAPPQRSSQFSLTMREKKGGTVTGALFSIARKLAQHRPELLRDATALEIQVKLVGIVGEFTLERPWSLEEAEPRPLLWLAGGIGITPFLAMLRGLSAAPRVPSPSPSPPRDIRLLVSTREPDALAALIVQSVSNDAPPHGCASVRLTVDVFSKVPFTPPSVPPRSAAEVTFARCQGRVDASHIKDVKDVTRRTAYVCGPPGFERSVLDSLAAVGVDSDAVKREGFEY